MEAGLNRRTNNVFGDQPMFLTGQSPPLRSPAGAADMHPRADMKTACRRSRSDGLAKRPQPCAWLGLGRGTKEKEPRIAGLPSVYAHTTKNSGALDTGTRESTRTA